MAATPQKRQRLAVLRNDDLAQERELSGARVFNIVLTEMVSRGASAPLVMLQNANTLTSIELPGPASDEGLFRIIDLLGGPEHFASVLHVHQEQPTSINAVPELQLRPDDAFAHPVSGSIVATANPLVKVTRRRRKRRRLDGSNDDFEGYFAIEHVGNITRTVRFRDLQDYQYAAPMDEPAVKLSNGMRQLDVQMLTDFVFPDPHEDSPDNLRLVPPPVFSRIPLPQAYGYKKNPQTKTEQVTNIRGEEIDRLRNTSRYALVTPITLNYADEAVPTSPPAGVKEGYGTEPALIDRISALLKERPMWTRTALLNQLTPEQHRVVLYHKQALPYLSYSWNDGPFREMVCRFGWDPRKDPEARACQRIQVRNLADKQMKPKSGLGSSTSARSWSTKEIDRQSHVFDGVELHGAVGTYQLCDLLEPDLQKLVQNPRFFRAVCHPVDGWWVPDFMDHLRNILKQKFVALSSGVDIDPSHIANDIERALHLPGEGEIEPHPEPTEPVSGSDEPGSDTGTLAMSATSSAKRKNPNAPKKKDTKRKPMPKLAVSERNLPDALRVSSSDAAPVSAAMDQQES